MACGVLMVALGVALFLLTDVAANGVQGLRWTALLIGGGLLLLIPSKVFLTLILMTKNDPDG
ncbi:hypothetical protein EZV61_09835 [Corallincola luteus]|uniref:Uncharacterized protein n=1 Tax=Corallincola luteus TaxID=1775177 RepID=A0ABY2AJY8_9GAMM|nr:hypothetical protein [Corallincola luteus]TCI03176.1 hypothetical protein EZV61_09835 [Corallincola luteus]